MRCAFLFCWREKEEEEKGGKDAYSSYNPQQIVLAANAEYLFDSSKYLQAALRSSSSLLLLWNLFANRLLLPLAVFQLGNQPEKALLAYQRANAWQELFTLALTTGVAQDEIKELALDVAGTSSSLSPLFEIVLMPFLSSSHRQPHWQATIRRSCSCTPRVRPGSRSSGTSALRG